jgi:hypothetical protein
MVYEARRHFYGLVAGLEECMLEETDEMIDR